jgi:hypothetical protein
MSRWIIISVVVAIAATSIAFASPLFYDTEINESIPDSRTEETMPKTYQGTFVGVNDGVHNAEGKSKVIFLDDGREILRLEDFRSTNGPDLYVYLSTDTKASDIVSLGKLKANVGNQNYEIPNDTDLEKYNKVLIWCKSFSVLFGSAELQSTL